MKKKDEIKVCLVGSSGGHLTHLYMLKPFWKDKNRFWVTFDKEDARSLLEGEKVYPCYFPTNRSIKALIKNTKIAWDVLHKEKPDLIISCGAAVAVPFFYIGKMMGAKLVYIEVFDRIDKPTMTGKMVYSESLEVQISYIKEYINHRDDLVLLDVFADKRCTGTNFDRPEFERLLKALQERKINCIVVKDFSRLGRNFVETGQYLEQVFPLFGVRFIAINDNYDSLNSQSRDGMLVPIKSMINEMYSKDLSQKIQSCFRSKEARGEIYTLVPFGYKKDQKNHLILDEEVSDVVMQIFLWKKSGMKELEIAKKLSAQGIPTPFTRRCQLGYLKNTLRVKDPAWQPAFVTKVLENPVYTGTMIYNRIAYDETYRKIGENPRESWRMVPDNHPAIISWELFDEVSALRETGQAVRDERKKWCRQRRENNPNIFKGRIFCKECGEKLVCHWQSDGSLYFYCASCHVSISEKDLWNGIHKELHQRLEEHKNLKKLMQKNSGKSKFETEKVALNREMERLSGNIVRLKSQKRSGYEQYVFGKISKEKFLELKQNSENEIVKQKQEKSTKEKELALIQEELQQKKQITDGTEILLTADNLQQYVKKIEVDRRKSTYTEFVF